MRTPKEIDTILKIIAQNHMDNPAAENIVNTLAWVLGDNTLSPIEILESVEDD